jgi:hypothetical protein
MLKRLGWLGGLLLFPISVLAQETAPPSDPAQQLRELTWKLRICETEKAAVQSQTAQKLAEFEAALQRATAPQPKPAAPAGATPANPSAPQPPPPVQP